MGCFSSKESDPDAFSQPGRVLGSAPSSTTPLNPRGKPNPSSSVPRKVGGPPRTLGGSSSGGERESSASAAEEARRKAAEAAQARANASNSRGGKLQNQLSAQKKQTRTNTLKEASGEAVRTREVEESAETRNWN